jgi:hypothetical protein
VKWKPGVVVTTLAVDARVLSEMLSSTPGLTVLHDPPAVRLALPALLADDYTATPPNGHVGARRPAIDIEDHDSL